MRYFFTLLLFFIWSLSSCNHKNQSAPFHSTVDLLHQNQFQLTEVIIYDVFSPPVASRIYAYSSLAAYEAIRFQQPQSVSIVASMNGFDPMPQPVSNTEYDFALAATQAFFKVVRNVKVFSIDSLKAYEAAVDLYFKDHLSKEIYRRSVAFGDSVASVVLKRAKTDGYFSSRGKAKYLGSEEPGKWRPTPPDYLDGVEWCWNTMKPLFLDSASQFKPVRPPVYSKNVADSFYRFAKEVYDIHTKLTKEQKEIARYWDDNPFVIEHAGHLSFGKKKITPGGHWMGIAGIASKTSKADAVSTARAYALTAAALYDGFISCWDEKYRSNVVRPVTVINEWFDQTWTPFLQTPPFPEYSSGHSTISAAAATVLSALYGTSFRFNDTSDLRYIGMQKEFSSFEAASAEASISRLYGGIHYRFGIEAGVTQGKEVGMLIVRHMIPSTGSK